MEYTLDYWKNRSIYVAATDDGDEIVRKSTLLRPDPGQAIWQKLGFSAFFHFGINTFTDREWGLGTEDPKLFAPTELDTEQWIRAAKDAGAGLCILTCKHHDGFCLWPSKYTEHSVKNSPWKGGKGDVVREFSDACRKYGVKFGVYYSPWDRHEKCYGTGEAYNTYYKNQLTELLTQYGEVSELWLDGACGEGENGKKQEYDWVSFWSLAKKLQPGIVVTGVAPDSRWCGNEAGVCRTEEWAQTFLPKLCEVNGVTADGDEDKMFALSVVGHNLLSECQKTDLTSENALKNVYAGKEGWLTWYPPMVDTSIRPGWFYHGKEDDMVRSPGNLIDLYIHSNGGNAMLLLNLPPDRRGLIHENDVESLKIMGEYLTRVFGRNLAANAQITADATAAGTPESLLQEGGYWSSGGKSGELTFSLPKRMEINFISLREPIQNGQSIEEFTVLAHCPKHGWQGDTEGEWKEIAAGTTIGSRKILHFERTILDQVRIRISKSRAEAALEQISLHQD